MTDHTITCQLLNRMIEPNIATENWPIIRPLIDLLHSMSLEGHTSLPLSAARQLLSESLTSQWQRALDEEVINSRAISSGQNPHCPIVFDNGYLYWQRYHHLEVTIAESLLSRVNPLEFEKSTDPVIDRLFNPNNAHERQIDAARIATSQQLSIIVGGPGTGKTTTVAKILASLVELYDRTSLDILMLAPTGKAAARLAESMRHQIDQLDVSNDVKAQIPTEAKTIHRAIGLGRHKARFHANNPLLTDIVVVDEASMIDAGLMLKLLKALPAKTQLIFLGDANQLASVEAGSVLADLCLASQSPNSRLFGCLAELTHSYRFNDNSGIGRLASAIKQDNPDDAELILFNESHPELIHYTDLDIAALCTPYFDYLDTVASIVTDAPQPLIEALSHFSQWRILAATRDGDAGVHALTERIEAYLAERQSIVPSSEHYRGRPLMVLENDYNQNLFNGDIGIIVEVDGRLMACFEGENNQPRLVLPSRLPKVETAYVMTIHKSQGSEFEGCAVVLPDAPTEAQKSLLTRELLFTGLTRAKKRFVYVGTKKSLRYSIMNKTQRFSGLTARL
ncbi:MAG: exodeoxyribonuclease V subunit alpha [Gammaproteobacteria bacterium]|nr:exodeoxyribonuclease V subunit alpha [Gammaproteobacteria bacterium]